MDYKLYKAVLQEKFGDWKDPKATNVPVMRSRKIFESTLSLQSRSFRGRARRAMRLHSNSLNDEEPPSPLRAGFFNAVAAHGHGLA